MRMEKTHARIQQHCDPTLRKKQKIKLSQEAEVYGEAFQKLALKTGPRTDPGVDTSLHLRGALLPIIYSILLSLCTRAFD